MEILTCCLYSWLWDKAGENTVYQLQQRMDDLDFWIIKYILSACLCGMEEQCLILKADLLPNLGDSPNCSGWDPDLIRVGASTLVLASHKVYYFSVNEIDFYVIIF